MRWEDLKILVVRREKMHALRLAIVDNLILIALVNRNVLLILMIW
jgi:hypothetical protein